MKKGWLAAAMSFVMVVGATGAAFVATDAEARRFGGASSQGMQRTLPAQRPATPPPAQQATPANATNAAAPAAAGATAGAAAKRSWMGPIAGLAAGLGLAALMSHLGLGEQFANFLMIALLLLGAFVVIRLLMRRFGPQASAQAVPRWQAAGVGNPMAQPMQRSSFEPAAGVSAYAPAASAVAASSQAATIPADFDTESFERIAKMIFIRMQTANDAGDLDDLRNFTTPEMFAAVRLELQERGQKPQKTDVMKVDAEVIDVAEEAGRQIVSVRFHGLIREESDAAASDFDEVWHLVKPVDDSRSWAIAGIQQQ